MWHQMRRYSYFHHVRDWMVEPTPIERKLEAATLDGM